MLKLIDFYADWCGPCQALKPDLEKLEKEFHNKIEFEKVNVDENSELAQKFGIMSIPTLVLVNGDREVDRQVGLKPKEELKEWLESKL